MTEAKGDGGEGFYVRGRSGQKNIEQGTYSAWSKLQGRSRLGCYICQSEEHLKRDCPRYSHKKSQGYVRIEDHVSGSGADGYILELRQNLISLGTLEKEGFTVKMQTGKIKVIKGSLVVLSGTRRANCVYTLDGQAVTRKTLKGRKQLGEYQIGWKIKTGLQQQNGFVEETNVTLLAKWVIKLWRLDDVTSKVVLYRNMGFNKIGEYKKTFIGSGVGTGSVQVLQGVEFEVELEQHSAWELFNYREGSNEATFAVAEAEKIYAHESLTFNNTVAYEGSLSGDCDVEKNVKWSYAVGSQEYQMVCTRLDIASTDVGMLHKFDRGLQTDVQVFVDFVTPPKYQSIMAIEGV
ncbi:zinc finger, CCHC-type containing protein [Tanacetum coccineum]